MSAESSANQGPTPSGEPTPSVSSTPVVDPSTHLEPASPLDRAFAIAVFVLVSLIVLFGLPNYGIWDPWELGIADDARHLIANEAIEAVRPPLTTWFVGQGFALFGVEEWSGRLPIAFAAILLIGLCIIVGHLFGDLRRGTYTALIAGTTPFFLLNARHMMGAALGFLASSLVFVAACVLAFTPRSDRKLRIGALIALPLAVLFATSSAGVLLGVAPPLLAVGMAIIARLRWHDRPFAPPTDSESRERTGAHLLVLVLAIIAGVGTVMAVMNNVEGYSAWTGGLPLRQVPPTFEVPIEAIFHSFAPWSAILPLAFGFLMVEYRQEGATPNQDTRDPIRGVSLAALAWCGFAYAADAVHAARYGAGSFLAVLGLSWLVASFLRGLERTSRGENWARGLVALLLSALLIRDFAGYPGSPLEGLSLSALTVPEAFNPRAGWAVVLGAFGLAAFLGLASDMSGKPEHFAVAMGGSSPRDFKGALIHAFLPIHLLRAQWTRGLGFRVWLGFVALLTSTLLGFGLVGFGLRAALRGAEDNAVFEIAMRVIPIWAIAGAVVLVLGGIGAFLLYRGKRKGVGLLAALAFLGAGIAIGALIFLALGGNSLATRVALYIFVVPFGIILGIGVGRVAYHFATSLRQLSFVPLFASALVVAVWFVGFFHPQASAHFSPREIYDTYNALASDNEPLGEYQVGGRAAAYYTDGEIVDLANESDALTFLARPTRVWLALPAEQLAQLDRGYRTRANHHLFIADARSARVLLATNQPVSGRADENYLANVVLDTPPAMQQVVNASLDRRISLLGFNLDLPNGDSVGPGQSFAVTWVWRCDAPTPGGYQPFLHIDGFGQRLNGDHEPVDGRYPVRMWNQGDIVLDRHELRVPANFPPGDYTFYIGMYAGESRLDVVEGPEDDANRIAAGRLRVR